jgi:uncharacterized membrane protein YfcA
MTPVAFIFAVFGISLLGGLLGSLVGLGGGIIVVPGLTLLMGVDIRHAIAASIVSVIATSSGAGAAYIKDRMVNIRVGMFLELGTTFGAIAGALLAGALGGRWLYLGFAGILLYTASALVRHGRQAACAAVLPDHLADDFNLHGSYLDRFTERQTEYKVGRTKSSFGLSIFAGVVSGLLGVGGGVIKVPVMALRMGIPLKVATATSNFMIGVTAAAGAGVYFARGDMLPFIAAPTALGVLGGSLVGSRIMGRVPNSALRKIFIVVVLITAVQMLRKGMR